MKKIYFLASAVVLAGSLSAQNINQEVQSVPSMYVPSNSGTSNSGGELTKKIPGEILWSEDFEFGLSGNNPSTVPNWSSGSTGVDDYSDVWSHDFAGPTGAFSSTIGPLESASASNGWMLFDINARTDIESPGGFITADGYIESPEIDISAMPAYINLEVEQYYRTCCFGGVNAPVDFFVGYSTDNGITYTWVEKNSGNDASNVTPGDGTANLELREVGITDVTDLARATGYENIKLRFHWNSVGNASVSYYFWMIDDIKLKEAFQSNARHDKMYAGDIYNDFDPYLIPQSQAHNMVVGSDVTNLGGTALTNMQMNVTIQEDATAGIVHSGSSTPATLAVGAETKFVTDAELAGTNVWYDSGVSAFNNGVHTVEIVIGSDMDDDLTNNTLTHKFEYNDFEYGHYNPTSPDANGVRQVNDDANEGAMGSAVSIKADETVYGIVLDIQDGATVSNDAGIFFEVQLTSDWFGTLTTEEFEEFELTQEMIDCGEPITFGFSNPYDVFTDDVIYASVRAFGDGNLYVSSDSDGDDDNSTGLQINGTTYAASFDPYVNLSFNPEAALPKMNGKCGILSVEDNENNISLLNNTPNPATNNTTINYSIANADNVTLEVVDITGKVVATVNEGTRSAGAYSIELNTADFSNGIYFYTLVSGQNKLTNKMIVNK